MRTLCWNGVNDLGVETVADPEILNPNDAILKVRLSTTCGSDLHLIDGLIPTMREGDVLGHEFMGEIVDVGAAVTKVAKGDRVVVPSFISCGRCWYCQHDLYSLCDTTHPKLELQEPLLGYPTAGVYAYFACNRRLCGRPRPICPRALREHRLFPGARRRLRRNRAVHFQRCADRLHGQAYVPRLLEHAQRGELTPASLVTHRFSLEDGPTGYDMFKHKEDGCLRAVFTP